MGRDESASERSTGSLATRLLPILGQLRSYDRAWLRGDLIAGVTVAALIVPKNLGYAGIAGIPLQNGLYAAAAGAHPVRDLRHLPADLDGPQLGPGRGGRECGARRRASPEEQDVASFVAGITLASGVLFLLLAVLKMGWIAQFLSRAVVTGFLFGAAIDVVIGELPKLTGTEVTGSNSDPGTVVLAGDRWARHTRRDGDRRRRSSLVVVFGLTAVAPQVPGALVLVVGGLLASACSISAPRASRSWATCRAGCPSFEVPDGR